MPPLWGGINAHPSGELEGALYTYKYDRLIFSH